MNICNERLQRFLNERFRKSNLAVVELRRHGVLRQWLVASRAGKDDAAQAPRTFGATYEASIAKAVEATKAMERVEPVQDERWRAVDGCRWHWHPPTCCTLG